MKRLLLPVLLALVSFPLFSQEFGLASYYSDTYQGKPTAYGETYGSAQAASLGHYAASNPRGQWQVGGGAGQ